jgi:hypothetical protein
MQEQAPAATAQALATEGVDQAKLEPETQRKSMVICTSELSMPRSSPVFRLVPPAASHSLPPLLSRPWLSLM